MWTEVPAIYSKHKKWEKYYNRMGFIHGFFSMIINNGINFIIMPCYDDLRSLFPLYSRPSNMNVWMSDLYLCVSLSRMKIEGKKSKKLCSMLTQHYRHYKEQTSERDGGFHHEWIELRIEWNAFSMPHLYAIKCSSTVRQTVSKAWLKIITRGMNWLHFNFSLFSLF